MGGKSPLKLARASNSVPPAEIYKVLSFLHNVAVLLDRIEA